jgi:hypothetical protein
MTVSETASLLRATEALVRAVFDGACAGHDSLNPDLIVALQGQFRASVRVAERHFQATKRVIARWRERVQCGEVDFEQAQEDRFLDALTAFSSLASTLSETFDQLHGRGVFLCKPRAVGVLTDRRREAQRILSAWVSPEWEVTDPRTVKWNEEQTKHLWERLDSRG